MVDGMAEQLVLYDIRDSVAVLTLNRPDSLNAWTPRLENAYGAALDTATADREVRAIVVTGAGRGFCAGADARVLDGYSTGRRPAEGTLRRTQLQFELTVPKPVIAAVNGPCAGIGMARALFCDLRFAASKAFFTTSYARRGLIAEHGTSWLLPRLVGASRAADLLLSGRRVGADEALRIGLVDRVAEDSVVDQAVEYARDLAANCSPSAMATIKRQLWADSERSLEASFQDAEQLAHRCYDSPDFTEGIRSFVEKRPARFAPFEDAGTGSPLR